MDKDLKLQTFFRVNVPELGFANLVVLHSLLAVSGAHLARFRHEARSRYLALAHAHYQAVLRFGTARLAAFEAAHAGARFLFVNLCSGFALGAGPRPGDFLLFSTSGPAEWVVLFRGVRTLLEAHGELLMSGPLAPMFQAAIRQVVRADQPVPQLDHVRTLRTQIEDALGPDNLHLPTYNHAIDSLGRSWPKQTLPSTLQTVGSWLYRVSDGFVERL
jgi:hypothetical protein